MSQHSAELPPTPVHVDNDSRLRLLPDPRHPGHSIHVLVACPAPGIIWSSTFKYVPNPHPTPKQRDEPKCIVQLLDNEDVKKLELLTASIHDSCRVQLEAVHRMGLLDFDGDPIGVSAEQHQEPSAGVTGTLSPLEELLKAEKQAKNKQKDKKRAQYHQHLRRCSK